MNFADLIRSTRTELKLSQKALADQISTSAKPKGVWATYIGQIEKGQKIPADEVCIELARILQLDRDIVLLLAYQARSESDEARALFERLLNSNQQPTTELDDPQLRSLVRECRPWLQSLAQIHRAHRTRKEDIQALLSDLASLDKKQWEAAKILFARFKDPFEEEA